MMPDARMPGCQDMTKATIISIVQYIQSIQYQYNSNTRIRNSILSYETQHQSHRIQTTCTTRCGGVVFFTSGCQGQPGQLQQLHSIILHNQRITIQSGLLLFINYKYTHPGQLQQHSLVPIQIGTERRYKNMICVYTHAQFQNHSLTYASILQDN